MCGEVVKAEELLMRTCLFAETSSIRDACLGVEPRLRLVEDIDAVRHLFALVGEIFRFGTRWIDYPRPIITLLHFLWLSSEANSRADTLWRSGCKRQL